MPPELWTSGDICKRYGITRNTLRRWRHAHGFPEPLLYSSNRGGVWDAAEVRAWKAKRDNRYGSNRGAVIRSWRAHHDVAIVAERCGVPKTTVRGWLIDAGELEGREAA